MGVYGEPAVGGGRSAAVGSVRHPRPHRRGRAGRRPSRARGDRGAGRRQAPAPRPADRPQRAEQVPARGAAGPAGGQVLHRAGIRHGDFKPGNILMGPESPVVIDFGVARALDTPGTTSSGSVMGTPAAYLAPEQLGGVPVTAAADIFAWGGTVVFAASGRSAFGADSTPAVINRILNQEPDISGLSGTGHRRPVQGSGRRCAVRCRRGHV
ncbi:phosphotransferase [Nonomuraea sp. NPDC050786]|uniref:protein kinase domain-containing protein n=1 Tax=Nonomuraea sp. NPDC050786 TaxID=3154840 RepID=UPI0033CDA285